MTTEERLARVEQELAGAKRRSRRLLAALAVCVGVVSSAAWAFGLTAATAQPAAPGVLRAEQFQLVDANGKVRGLLDVDDKDGPRLLLFDGNFKHRVALGVVADGPWLHLVDANGKTRIGLSVDKDEPWLCLTDADRKERIGLRVLKDGPVLNLHGKNGIGVGLGVQDGKPALHLVDANGKTRIGLTVDKDEPWLGLYDANEQPIWSAP